MSAWCLEHGFELLRCSLDAEDLGAARKSWLDARQSGRPLLAEDDDRGLERLVEALKCYEWPGCDFK